MKKGVFWLLFLILFSLNAFATHDPNELHGANICNLQGSCDPSADGFCFGECGNNNDGICPSDFFPNDKKCYIRDEDCCNIAIDSSELQLGWSSDETQFVSLTEAIEGENIFILLKLLTNALEKMLILIFI